MPRAPVRSSVRPSVRALRWVAISAVIAGCTASADDVHPPRDQLFFPTGITVSPDERVLFVTNANSDQRYDSGSIGVITLGDPAKDPGGVNAVVDAWIGGGKVPDGCSIDPDHRETLVCDEAMFFDPAASVRIGNFASDLAIQDLQTSAGKSRLFVPTRGDPSVAWAEYYNNKLNCTADSEVFPLCDDAHRLITLQNNPDLAALPREPFSTFAQGDNGRSDGSHGFAMVTHILTGAVTLIRAPVESNQVAIVDMLDQQFAGNLTNGARSASAVAGRITASGEDIVYVGSGTESRIQTYTVGERDGVAAFLLPGSYFFLDSVGQAAGIANTQALQFTSGGDQMYLVNRNPPSLQIYDTSTGPTGVPRNALRGSSDICPQASKLTVLGQGDRERAYVACFQDGQVYVVDPRGTSQVEDVISVGRGPYGAAATSGKLAVGKPRLFVSNYFEDTIAVVELAEGAQHDRVVLRIGKPKVQ